MRLNVLDLTAYGHFSNVRLILPAPPTGAPDLHIVYGPNEAGKSTLLAAWLDLLFGFPNITRYDFLHDKRALRVQADLSDSTGRVHRLARIKGGQNTLLDAATDQPLPESTLSGLLGGLDRAAYGTMFSLDDVTLIGGSKAIMASEGDLGQLLFQGTAGLAELGARLRALRAQAEEWFSPPPRRKMVLANHKSRLAELKAMRKDVDLSLGEWTKLTQAVTQAEHAYSIAQKAQRDIAMRHQILQRDLDALPILERLRRTETQLAKLPAPQAIPADWRAALPTWQAEEAALAALVPHAAHDLEQAQIALTHANVDDAAIPFLTQIDDLEQQFGAINKELADLPRRQTELATLADKMQALAVRVGRPDADPQTLILPAPLVAALTEQMTIAATMLSQRQSAEAEVSRAQDSLNAQQAGLSHGADDVPDVAPLAELLDQIRSAEPARAVAMAQGDLGQASAALESAVAALVPWQGDLQALSAMDLPALDSLRALQADLSARQDDLRAALDVQKRLEQAVARGKAGLDQADLPDAADLSASRAARDIAWMAHKGALSAETAKIFENAMLSDDQKHAAALRAARLFERAEALRADTAELAVAKQGTAAARAAHDAVQARIAQIWARISPDTTRSLSDLIDWYGRRAVALVCLADRNRAQAAQNAAVEALAKWDSALETFLPSGRAGGGFAARLSIAQALLTKAAAGQQARAAVAAAQAELRVRITAREACFAAHRDWQEKWKTLVSRAGWGADPMPDVVQMRAILGILAELPAISAQAGDLSHRIDRIIQDAESFATRIADIAHGLGEAVGADVRLFWPQLRDRLRRARDGLDTRARLFQGLAKAQAHLDGLQHRQRMLDAATAPLREAFDGPSLAHIAEKFNQLTQADTLHAQAEERRADLLALLHTDDLPGAIERLDMLDPAILQAEAATWQAALREEQDALQRSFADLAAAKRDRDSVGNDARAAQLDEERQTLALQIREEAQGYLSRQAAILAVEAALRLYRETHRSSMMDRAGAAFQALTGGRYAGLGTQPDGPRELLIAREQTGGTKVVDTLSKGTAFQLYLALRIAGYQELADQRPMVPFIADDIMESFDNDRAAAAFGLLGQMAQRGQVIYLTHHAHLCTIARATCPQVQIHDLRAL